MRNIAWAAGIFEGEGCFGLMHKGFPRVRLKMTDEDIVRGFAAVVGCGNIHGPHGPYGPNRKPYWDWEASGDDAQRIVGLFMPYLGERRTWEAERLLSWQRQQARVALCGTHSGAMAHYRKGEKPCESCRRAHSEYEVERWHAGMGERRNAKRRAERSVA